MKKDFHSKTPGNVNISVFSQFLCPGVGGDGLGSETYSSTVGSVCRMWETPKWQVATQIKRGGVLWRTVQLRQRGSVNGMRVNSSTSAGKPKKVNRMPGKGEKGGDGRRPDHRLPSPFFSLFKSLPPSPTPKKSLDVMVRPLGKSEVSSYAFDAPSPPENAA